MNYDVVQGSYRLTDILTYSGGAAIGDTTPVGQACSTLGAGAIQCLSYQYNKTSDILQINDFSSGGVNRQFGYDDLHQLTSATGPWGVQGFTYDEIGNITSKASARMPKTGIASVDEMALRVLANVPGISATQAYSYDPVRPQILTGVGTDSYQFDPYGNLNKRNAQSFQFDSLNHLVSFSGSVQERYFYDEGGDRLEKKSPAESDFFASKYFEKRGNASFRYVFAGTKRLAVVPDNGTSTEYIHGDHLGSSNAVTDATGAVTLHREFAPYGEVVAQNGSYTSLNFGFTDKYQDATSGLNYFGQRYFLSGVGRWTAADAKWTDDLSPADKKARAETEGEHFFHDLQRIGLWGFVLNQPTHLYEKNGNDAFVIQATQAVGGKGHTGLIVGNEMSGYQYVSFGAANGGTSTPSKSSPGGPVSASAGNLVQTLSTGVRGDWIRCQIPLLLV